MKLLTGKAEDNTEPRLVTTRPIEVSNLGNIRHIHTHQLKAQHLNQDGYSCCNGASPTTQRVNRIVADAFIPNPENKTTVNHINGIKTDNRVENLEWATRSEQMQHAYKLGLKKPVVKQNQVLTDEQAAEIKRLYVPRSKEFGMLALAEKYGVSSCTIKRCVTGKTYKNVNSKV